MGGSTKLLSRQHRWWHVALAAACMTILHLVFEVAAWMTFPSRSGHVHATLAALPLRYAMFCLFFYCTFRWMSKGAAMWRQIVYASFLSMLLLGALWVPTWIMQALLR